MLGCFPPQRRGGFPNFVNFYFSLSVSPFLHGYREGQFSLMKPRQGVGDGGRCR